MTDRPIIFSAPMVRAILDGRKTQTRRVLKPQPDPALPIAGAAFVVMGDDPGRWCWLNRFDGSIVSTFNPPCAPGDRLWVREVWSGPLLWGAMRPIDRGRCGSPQAAEVHYWADGNPFNGDWEKPRPSIHMPRWASRLTLPVTDVWIERVQDISEEDAIAEGFGGHPDPIGALALLWDSLNAARGYGWDANPWVIARTFTAERRNIDSDGGKDG